MRGRRAIARALMAGTWPFQAALAIAQETAGDPTKLPFREDGSAEVWRTGFSGILVALLLLGVVAAGLYFWRHRTRLQNGVPNAQMAIRVDWARRVSPRTTLMVVRWHGREYLLAENGTATQVIDSKAAEELRT